MSRLSVYAFMVFDSSFKEASSLPVSTFSKKPSPRRFLGLGVDSWGHAAAPEKSDSTSASPAVGLEGLYSVSIPSQSLCSSLAVGAVLKPQLYTTAAVANQT